MPELDLDRYSCRPYAAADREGVRALYGAVRDEPPTEEWLDWKFEENPYSPDPPMVVATGPDGVVAARPVLLFPLRGEESYRGRCFVNAMVAPEHRGNGLFSRLTERATSLFDDVDIAFGIANDNSRPIYAHWGWTVVGPTRSHYRIQRPAAVAAAYGDGAAADVLGRAGNAVARGVYSALAPDPGGGSATVRRIDGVPPERLAALYERAIPDRLHVPADEQFYRWRHRSPIWEPTTYLARIDDRDVAAIVTRTRRGSDDDLRVQVTDVLPFRGGDDRRVGLEAAFARAIHDHRQAGVIVATGSGLPASIRIRFGFVPGDRPPLSLLSRPHNLVVNPERTAVAPDPTEPSNWRLPLSVRSTR